MRKEQHFDIEQARGFYTKTGPAGFSKYSPAYIVTNEDLREVMQNSNPKSKRVLTTAASGDHPLFYSLFGAKHVDTFDISYCARAIMDIKTTAVKILNPQQYVEMLQDLHEYRGSDAAHFSKIAKHIPADSADFIKHMGNLPIFCHGQGPNAYRGYMPNEIEYVKLRNIIKQPYNFIWSDVYDLHSHLNKQYDIINLSNIEQYLEFDKFIQVLDSLHSCLLPGGEIISMSLITNYLSLYANAQENIKKWAKITVKDADGADIVILQKSR